MSEMLHTHLRQNCGNRRLALDFRLQPIGGNEAATGVLMSINVVAQDSDDHSSA